MSSPGYKLSAQIVEEAIEEAYKLAQIDGQFPSAFLLCDPNNPLSTALEKDDLQAIADVLRAYPSINIVLDEAYAEMRLDYKRESLFSVAPDLANRMILIRSATKAFSAAGERMAVVVACDDKIMSELTAEHTNICGHAPKSSQILFADAMTRLTEKKQESLMDYYSKKIFYVEKRIEELHAKLPDTNYCSRGTFYVLANLQDLIGTPINKDCFRAIQRQMSEKNSPALIETDEEIVYHLLFTYGVMVAPLSYFGLSNQLGYIRITCSAEKNELEEMMDKIECALNMAKAFKKEFLVEDITNNEKSLCIESCHVKDEVLGITC